MKKIIRLSLTAIITMLLCLIIAPSAFAEDTVYTTSNVTGGIRIDSVTTTETILEIPEEIDGKVVVALGGKAFSGTPVEEITVPATVTSMNSYVSGYYSAFYGMENLKKVTFSEGMRTIPASALSECTTVTEVVLPESLTTISNNAFFGCTALTTINLPDSITSIGKEAFYNCTSLEEVDLPENLTTIYEGAFAFCSKIKEIILPDALTEIKGLAFYKTQISEITVPANVTSMASYTNIYNVSSDNYSALYGMENLKKVIFAEGMKAVPVRAIEYCSGVIEVILPESITSISYYAFRNCTALTTINFPDSITFIGQEAFYNCTSLENVVLPENLTTIYEGAFAFCSKIKEIILPDALTEIKGLAFYKTQISEIIIPASVTSMSSYTNIHNVSSNNYSSLYGMEKLTKVTFSDGMKDVPVRAIENCNGVTEVILPESITSISYYAFRNCTALTTINFPDSITFIGQEAFYNCTSLENVDLPEDLTTIYDGAFAFCSKIKEITLPDLLTEIKGLAFYKTQITEIVIPASVEKMNSYCSTGDLKSDNYSALYGMANLEKVTFSEGMKAVPVRAIENCPTAKEVVLPESLTAISNSAFRNCTALTTINLPDSIETIGNEAFCNCTSLSEVKLPASLTKLYDGAFAFCSKIKTITLPDSLKEMYGLVFYKTGITEIVIPESVEKMNSYSSTEKLKSDNYSALYGISPLKKVTFADGMSSIPKWALIYCTFKEVVIYDCNTSLEAMQADAEANGYTLTVLPCGECQHENTEIRNAVAVTCLENGYTGDTYCTDCDELITEGEVITAAGSHDYKSETVKTATCSAEGEVKYTCSVCGDNYTEATAKDPANHTGDTEIRDAKDATCTEKGYTGDTYCKACNTKLDSGSETAMTAHTEVVVKGSDAKCTTPGMTDGVECSVCGAVIEAQEEIPAKGHTYGEWTVVKNPTSTEEGSEERICTSCGEAETRAIEKLSYIVGDINGDGRITAADARLALRIAAHIDTIENLGTSLVVCDITLDNKVTAADARIILRKAAGLE